MKFFHWLHYQRKTYFWAIVDHQNSRSAKISDNKLTLWSLTVNGILKPSIASKLQFTIQISGSYDVENHWKSDFKFLASPKKLLSTLGTIFASIFGRKNLKNSVSNSVSNITKVCTRRKKEVSLKLTGENSCHFDNFHISNFCFLRLNIFRNAYEGFYIDYLLINHNESSSPTEVD